MGMKKMLNLETLNSFELHDNHVREVPNCSIKFADPYTNLCKPKRLGKKKKMTRIGEELKEKYLKAPSSVIV